MKQYQKICKICGNEVLNQKYCQNCILVLPELPSDLLDAPDLTKLSAELSELQFDISSIKFNPANLFNTIEQTELKNQPIDKENQDKVIRRCQTCDVEISKSKISDICSSCKDRQDYDWAKSEGLCVKCGNVAVPGKSRCQTCFDNMYASRKNKKQMSLEAGICTQCNTDTALPGKKLCQDCNEYYRERDKKDRQEKIKKNQVEGLCVECGKEPARENRKTCEGCKTKSTISKQKRVESAREKGFCISCTKAEAHYGDNCLPCALKKRYAQAKWQANNTKKVEWTLTRIEYYKLLKLDCYYCELPSNVVHGIGLDRILNEKNGYTTSNVLPCCELCNRTRQNLFASEHFKLYISPGIREYRLKTEDMVKLKEFVETRNLLLDKMIEDKNSTLNAQSS